MKVVFIVLSSLSVLGLLSTLICGFWIRGNSATITDMASSLNFHQNIAIFSIVMTIATIVVGVIRR
jgi:hypothetical protein